MSFNSTYYYWLIITHPYFSDSIRRWYRWRGAIDRVVWPKRNLLATKNRWQRGIYCSESGSTFHHLVKRSRGRIRGRGVAIHFFFPPFSFIFGIFLHVHYGIGEGSGIEEIYRKWGEDVENNRGTKDMEMRRTRMEDDSEEGMSELFLCVWRHRCWRVERSD